MINYRFRGPRDSLALAQTALKQWFSGTFGQYLLSQEQALIGGLLRQCYGQTLIQLSSDNNSELYSESRLARNIALSCYQQNNQSRHLAVTELESLPIATESVDVVVLHHVLEFSNHPHQIIREVQRILSPHGKIIVVGINPNSFLGFQSLVKGVGVSDRVKASPISLSRLDDWLHLLGFGTPKQRYDCYEPPLNNRWLLERFMFLGQIAARFQLIGGGIYILESVKEVTRLTPISPKIHFGRVFDLPVFGSAATTKAANKKIH